MAYGNRATYWAMTLPAAAKLFLEKGYTNTTMKEIAKCAGIDYNSLNRTFRLKENVLGALVEQVLEGQFKRTAEFLAGKTDDPILFYAAETTLQLYMVESGENIRDLYATAYSLPNTTKIIQDTITAKLEHIFKEYLPHLQSKDFFECEIASGGIMRGFMTTPCDRYFTMERKVAAFLEASLKVYDVPKEKIQEAIAFVSQFDFETIAKQTIASMLESLEDRLA